MVRVVQKYGGTSVKDLDCIRFVAKKIKQRYELGEELVVVVSARAGVTDKLIAEAKLLAKSPNLRELDVLLCTGEQETISLLSIALNELEVQATSLLAFQIGLQTCFSHGRARIKHLLANEIENLLAKKNVVIVAGFQGITADGNLTTLGRGGSDLTALAIAHKIKADRCEIYTDVDGVFTGDPKIVQNAKLIKEIDFESLLRLSFFDNKVMQDRSIAFAQKNNVKFSISNTRKNFFGTHVSCDKTDYESCIIGITSKRNICLLSCETSQDIVVDILKFFKVHGIDLSFIKHRKLTENCFFDETALNKSDFENLHDNFINDFCNHINKFTLINDLSRIDIIGTNILAHTEALSAFEVLSKENVLRSEYGKHGLSFLLQSCSYEALLNKIHDIFFKKKQ